MFNWKSYCHISDKMSDKIRYSIAGLMSGTSLDGLDIALCDFFNEKETWSFIIHHGETRRFPEELAVRLRNAHNGSALELASLDKDFGYWCGVQVRDVCLQNQFSPLLVASHGHTVFHNPEKGITCQIGNAACLSVASGFMIVNDFRSADVALGGQGAPLVPVGDHMLFQSFDSCLNVGGIANISFATEKARIAFDIVPANMVLNNLANRLDLEYDDKGAIAASGKLCDKLLMKLNGLSYYKLPPPKSLAREWVSSEIFPLLEEICSVPDMLRTYTEHIAIQIAEVICSRSVNGSVLITGGGTRNDFLVSRINSIIKSNLTIPAESIIDYKEALIFGFLGLLRILELPNVMASVTGATHDHCAGAVTLESRVESREETLNVEH